MYADSNEAPTWRRFKKMVAERMRLRRERMLGWVVSIVAMVMRLAERVVWRTVVRMEADVLGRVDGDEIVG